MIAVEAIFEYVIHSLITAENLPLDSSTAECRLLFYETKYISMNVIVFQNFSGN
jgi:hypothetical protein